MQIAPLSAVLGCVVLSQPQRAAMAEVLRLVFDTATLHP
jgi:hypothetical protein